MKKVYTATYIKKLIERRVIHNILTALEHSMLKHKEVDDRNDHELDHLYFAHSSTCPMCIWVSGRKTKEISEGDISGKRCVLAGSKGGVCDNGVNCCNGLWVKYVKRGGERIKQRHLKLTNFITKRYEQLTGKHVKKKVKMKPFVLTKDHKLALESVVDGADIFSRIGAGLLRECEKEGLVIIGDAMGEYSGEERQPYFGALVTAAGKLVLKGASVASKLIEEAKDDD